ncbi:MAG: DUF2304 domain-containing protein [Bryobacteraceae bacterium]
MVPLLNLVSALGLLVIALVLVSIRREHIRVEYSVSWLAGAVALIALSRSPRAVEYVSRKLGIEDPALAILMLVGCLFVLIVFLISISISNLKDDNVALAQRVAILEYHIRSLQNSAAHENEAKSAP